MKRLVLYISGLMVLLLGCSDGLEFVEQPRDSVPLGIQVSQQPLAKAAVAGRYLPDGAEMGVFLRASDGSRYDAVSLKAAKYIANGEEAAQTWVTSGAQPMILTGSVGQVYGYYPWQDRDYPDLKVPIVNDGTDWMYTTYPATNVSVSNPVAQLQLSHAMAIIRCTLVKGAYTAAGGVTTVAVTSDALATGATMDLAQAKVSDFTGIGAEIAAKKVGNLGSEPLVVDLWAVPTGESAELHFSIVADGDRYLVSAPALTPEGGHVYNYTFTMSTVGMEVSAVRITDWSLDDQCGLLSGVADLWEEARQAEGVYAIDHYGQPVPYAEATADSYAGVAFAVRGRVYQVAKVDAIGSVGTTDMYWWKTGYVDIPELVDYRVPFQVTDITNVYLFPANPAEWTVGAVSEFCGAVNTEIIIAAQTKEGVVLDDTLAKAVVDFRANAEVNEGYDDWFCPSFGELCYMRRFLDQLEVLLQKAGGNVFSEIYASSTERSNSTFFYTRFLYGSWSGTFYKFEPIFVRLIRLIR